MVIIGEEDSQDMHQRRKEEKRREAKRGEEKGRIMRPKEKEAATSWLQQAG